MSQVRIGSDSKHALCSGGVPQPRSASPRPFGCIDSGLRCAGRTAEAGEPIAPDTPKGAKAQAPDQDWFDARDAAKVTTAYHRLPEGFSVHGAWSPVPSRLSACQSSTDAIPYVLAGAHGEGGAARVQHSGS